jgi:hypothetical protein
LIPLGSVQWLYNVLPGPLIIASVANIEVQQQQHEATATDGVIVLKDVQPTAVAAMVQHLYTCDYDAAKVSEDEAPILFHIKVSTIADKYE